MTMLSRTLAAGLAALALLAGCAPPGQPSSVEGPTPRSEVSQRGPLRLIIRDEPSMMDDRLDRNGFGYPVRVSLTHRDERDQVQPLLVEKVPSQDDGSWTINPDGSMRTTYRLKPDLKWQNGQRLVAGDFAFAHQVYTDRDVPVTTRVPESSMSAVVARDDRTVEIEWREPYIWANALSGGDLAPFPQHLLGDLFQSDKQGFANSSFWTSEEYVGNGPYGLSKWEKGIAITLTANPYFALGKPKIELLEFRFTTDANATVANFLAGTADFAQYTAINTEQALNLQERWEADNAGRIFSQSLWGVRYMEFQHRDVANHQKAVTDARVRRALVHALDRDSLSEALQQGFATAADSGFPRTHSLYPRLERVLDRYGFDLRRAEALLGEAGWTRGADGMLRNVAGQLLDMEVRVTSERQQEQAVIADDWKRAGISSSLAVVSRALTNDPEYRVSFPAVDVSSHSHNRDFVAAVNVTTEQAPTAQNRYTGKNRGTYFNANVDRLYDLYLKTVDPTRRDEVLIELERVFNVDVAQGMLYYIPQVAAIRANVGGIRPPIRGTYLWNIWEWTLG